MKFADILGQERPFKRLASWLKAKDLPPALLFKGPQGVGKAAAARLFARALNCEEGDFEPCGFCPPCLLSQQGIDGSVHFVDASYQAALEGKEAEKQSIWHIGTIRHVIKDLEMRSMAGRWKTAVVDDAHRLTPAAANAMLKALEEPPQKTLWILVTHRPFDLLATIRSRCQALPFSPLSEELLLQALAAAGVTDAAARAAAPLAEGSVRRALELAEDPQSEPSEWLGDPLGPFRLADALPKELHRSRPAAADQLHRMSWHLRRSRGIEGFRVGAVRSVLRELESLRKALRSNADPKLVLQVAGLRLQQLQEALAPRS